MARSLIKRSGDKCSVEAGAELEHGTMISLNASGKAVPATASGNAVLGIYEGSDKAPEGERVSITCKIVCAMDNSATDPVGVADTGKVCYVEDEGTVKKTGEGTTGLAGKVFEVLGDSVFVTFGA